MNEDGSPKYLYRYEDYIWGTNIKVGLLELPIIKATPTGVWVLHYGIKRHVKIPAKRQFAFPNKTDALESFIRRKEAQRQILNDKLDQCKAMLRIGKMKLEKMVHIQDYFDDITAGYNDDGTQRYTKWYISQGVTHWQSLPEPPEEKNKDAQL